MLKKTIKYKDYDGNEREETFYFNLNKAEIAEMELGQEGGLVNTINKIVEEKDNAALIKLFKSVILSAYGEKSADGRSFIKSEAATQAFTQTMAYSEIFMELAFQLRYLMIQPNVLQKQALVVNR